MLPNFNECWWDSWVLDVLICNWIGIATGMWTVKYFKSKQYNWSGISQQPNLLAKAKRGILQFTPKTFDDFQWHVFGTPKRFVQCFFPVIIILLFEVNHFFLKYELWVPPINPLNTYRLSLLFLLALPSIKVSFILSSLDECLVVFVYISLTKNMPNFFPLQEYYEFIESDSPDIFRKLGSFAWLGVAIAFVETMVVIKFGRGMFPQPWPKKVLITWGLAIGGLTAILTVWSINYYILDHSKTPRKAAKVTTKRTTKKQA